ncbi:hypothetical protein RHMOL_Rhmol01G0142200 [Rhododendron molle]|uniref:Uncharacterized protein n=1 Tax=Rhododendron molle TaxID=49168 RepID=A0ACC0Q4D1_RHOML|nr:hypothetical protein RHMOL_Rhmol01G0142200 [Rhododendron molle]
MRRSKHGKITKIEFAHHRSSIAKVMSYFASAEHEKERLQYFASPEGRDDLYQYITRRKELFWRCATKICPSSNFVKWIRFSSLQVNPDGMLLKPWRFVVDVFFLSKKRLFWQVKASEG